MNRLRDRGILAGTDGPHENVIKLRPPLVLSRAEAELFVATLDEILAEDRALAPDHGTPEPLGAGPDAASQPRTPNTGSAV